MAKVSLIEEETIKASVNDINYIPSYKIAEEERRKNELERIDKENEREAYYEEIQNKVANGEFNGKDGKDGRDGEPGKDGINGRDGVDGEPGKDGKDGKDGVDGAPGKDGKDGITPDMTNYYNKSEIDTMIGDIESLLKEV